MNARLTSGSPVSSLGRSFEIRRSAIAVAVGVAMLSLAVPGTAQTISDARTVFQSFGSGPVIDGTTITVTSTGSVITLAGNGVELIASEFQEAETFIVARSGGGATDRVVVSNSPLTVGAAVSSNTISNAGTINANSSGIVLAATAEAESQLLNVEANNTGGGSAIATISGSDVTIAASVSDNRITNSGLITSATGDGVALSAKVVVGDVTLSTSATESGGGSALAKILQSGVFVSASVDSNNISNSGSITALQGSGISLEASLSAGNVELKSLSDEENGGTATAWIGDSGSDGVGVSVSASIVSNTITNSGLITAEKDGVSLKTSITTGTVQLRAEASEDAGGVPNVQIKNAPVLREALISSNVITNSGVIIAERDGISLNASSDSGEISLIAKKNGVPVPGSIQNSTVTQTVSIANNTISNSGSIVAGVNGIELIAFTNDVGADADVTGKTINNSGSITSGGTGILLSADNVNDNTINVSGSIISSFTPDVFTAVQIGGAGFGNTLNISAPAYLAGEINLASAADVGVNLTSGPSNSVSWSITKDETYGQRNQSVDMSPKAMLSGPVPWFVNEDGDYDVYATIDPSAFAAANNVLADLSGMTSTFAMRALDQSTVRDFWFSPYGSKMDYDGDGRATLEQKQKQSGAALGYTQLIRPDLKIGGMLGYGEGTMKVGSRFASSYDNKTEGAFAGIYGRWLPADKRLWVDFAFTAGRLSHKDSRFVNDNLVALGASTAAGSYDSTWFSPEIKLVGNFPQATGFTLNPSLQLRYAMQKVDGYTETGTNANASVGSRDVAVMEARAELAGTRPTSFGNYTLRGGYWYRSNQGDSSVRVTMIGDTKDVSTFYSDLGAGYAGLDMNFKLGQTAFFSLGVNGMLSSKVSGGSVVGTLNVPF